jgi:Cu/Ag efflux pump CusA
VIVRIIEASVRNRMMVLIVAGMLVGLGVWSIKTIPVDAIPDLSDVQVIVYTGYSGQAPQVVEDQVTYPLTTAMLSVPYASVVRGYSFFGFSMVYIIFEDGTDLYWARSRVLEYLNYVQARLPAGVTPQLGPDATGVGWIYQYTLTDFSPRARVLRQRLDRDGSGSVTPDELPKPEAKVLVGAVSECAFRLLAWCVREESRGGEEHAVYPEPQLAKLFAVERPPATRSEKEFQQESVGFLLDGFDQNRDEHISEEELLRAANFMGIDLAQLRSLQDWYFRYDLMSQQGVSEVASIGGFVRQYQVEVDPEKLRAFGVTIPEVRSAIQRANVDTGGRVIEMAETEFMVRSQGYIQSVEDLKTVPVGLDEARHTPVFLSQVARVQVGPEMRRGLVDMNGEGEVVTGIVLVRFCGNALEVIERVKT